MKRFLLDSSQKACGRGCDCDARGDGQNGEDGGLCEHGVDFLGVWCCLFLDVEGYRRVEMQRLLKGKYRRWSSNEWEVAGGLQ
jgi:hypothetical protein